MTDPMTDPMTENGPAGAIDLPSGTVSFMFTDIEGSTRLLQELGRGYADLLDRHRAVVRGVVERHGGRVFGTEGDAFFVVFPSASAAVRAALEVQRALAQGDEVLVRIGLHTGEGVLREGDYVGLDVHRAARIAAAGHGGQIVLSDATRSLVEQDLPEGAALRDLGEHALKDLHRPEHLFQLDVEGLPVRFPPLRTAGVRTGNLPVQLTSFVGRDAELETATGLLEGTRLLTLTGPGGTGKTRLAIQLAGRVRPRFPGGAWFVPLASVTDPEMVPTAVAEAVGLSDMRDARPPLEQVIDQFRGRETLLVLDNFEQILPAAGVVGRLLTELPGLRVVVTTRSVLHVYGEREFAVPPLGLPDPRHLPGLAALSQYEAVALFIDRATGVKPNFEVTNDNAPAVAEICARLDGLPLAIELAAARIRLLTPHAILARLSDRLALLAGGSRDLPARQQTLRQAIAWSHDLLSESEQLMFARMAVFMGGATLEEAEAVCGAGSGLGMDVLDGLTSLVEQSLLTVREDFATGTRFGMLETIREFGLERLAGSDQAELVARRHAEAYLALALQAEPMFGGRHTKWWLDRLEPEHDNIRSALEWAISRNEAIIALPLAASLWRFWQMRGHLQEGAAWVERALAISGARDHPRELARALEAAGGLAYWQADLPAQDRLYKEALAVAETLGDPSVLAGALYNAAFGLILPDPAGAASMLRRSLELYEQLGDDKGIAKLKWGLGNAEYARSNFEGAEPYFLEALEGARATGDDFNTGWSLFMLGETQLHLRRHEEARVRLREGLRLFAETMDLTGILFCVDALSMLEILEGRFERGLRLGAAAASLRASTGADLVEWEEQVRGRPGVPDLDPEILARAKAEGEAMTLDETVADASAD